MEVEVKLRLPQVAHTSLIEVLKPYYQTTYFQENYFFDGQNKELSAQRVVLRLRFYNKDEKAVVTIKGRQVLKDGVGRASEQEADVDPNLAREFLNNPEGLLNLDIALMKELKRDYNLPGLVCLGGFKNIRKVHSWEELVLEVDETNYDWGTLYEVECETEQPEVVKPKLENFLQGNGIEFSYSSSTKFANFISKTLQ
eukprot:TRINITY_DN5525_c0_g6_i1.p2 TRINITY_DN5525_c0_g6~~TRINITY_DN5525_c0_g6_i1.p2  ORF type:complete len:198 (-),score=33.02 TRINITY_DN5525_c0_g6_i1:332-925(-)